MRARGGGKCEAASPVWRLLPVAVLIAVVVLLLLSLRSTKIDGDAAPAGQVGAAGGLSRARALNEVIHSARTLATRPSPAPTNTRAVAPRPAPNADELRQRVGLPPTMGLLSEAQSFRRPTAAEAQHPLLRKLYLLESRIHRAEKLAQHEAVEIARFERDAERSTDPAQKQLLSQAAADHVARARRYRDEADQLRQEWGKKVYAATGAGR